MATVEGELNNRMADPHQPSSRFSTTRWTLVRQAGESDGAEAQQALADLCELYWYPLYAFARRKGHDEEAAANLVQALFLDLIERDSLKNVGQEGGRFRNYLMTVLKNLDLKQLRDAARQKRGGGRAPLALDFAAAEEQFSLDPVDDGPGPEALLLRDWALCIVAAAKSTLRREEKKAQRGQLYEDLDPLLSAPVSAEIYLKLGQSHGLASGTVKVRLHRLRRRFGELVREAVAETVDDPDDIEAELTCLMEALT